VGVQGRDIATMLQNDGIAIAVLNATKYDLAVAGRLDRRASRRRIVNAPVGANRI
jgi:hypothetical protein